MSKGLLSILFGASILLGGCAGDKAAIARKWNNDITHDPVTGRVIIGENTPYALWGAEIPQFFDVSFEHNFEEVYNVIEPRDKLARGEISLGLNLDFKWHNDFFKIDLSDFNKYFGLGGYISPQTEDKPVTPDMPNPPEENYIQKYYPDEGEVYTF